jgi:hypothetical protein
MRRRVPYSYSCFSAGTFPTEMERGAQMYQGFEQELARERVAQMRTEVGRNRLKARLARAARSDEDGVASRGWVASSAALVTALFR